jgi:hypothetical protein
LLSSFIIYIIYKNFSFSHPRPNDGSFLSCCSSPELSAGGVSGASSS